jgi:protein DJ-1
MYLNYNNLFIYYNTSRGPGTALLFALTIVELLLGEEKRNEVSNHMIVASIL